MTLAEHSTLLEDERVSVHRFDFLPGDETGQHRHARPYVIVPLTNGVLDIIDDETGKARVSLEHGVPYSRPKGVSHNVINASENPLSFLEIEIKS